MGYENYGLTQGISVKPCSAVAGEKTIEEEAMRKSARKRNDANFLSMVDDDIPQVNNDNLKS